MNALIVLACLGIVAMMSEVLGFKKFLLPIVALGLVSVIGLFVMDWNTAIRYYNDMLYFDNYAIAFSAMVTVLTALWLIMSKEYFISTSSKAEHAALILFCLTGAIVMISYSDLSMLFIGIEILSISLYVLAASNKNDLRSNEAGLKYFLMGAFATGFLLFGITLIYGASGSFNLQEIANYISTNSGHLPMFVYAGVLLMLVGLLFKVSAAPFHFWAPDVYEGSPTLVTAFMSTVVKTAAFAAFYRLFATCFSDLSGWWGETIAFVAALTMLVGNVLAVMQQNFKRMLAYSSIAHAGYMLMAIVAMSHVSAGAIFLYTTAYSVASLGAFACLHTLGANNNEKIINLKGLIAKQPLNAGLLCLAMLSLAGIPPLAGFFAKYYLFYGVIQSGYLWLVMVAVLSSLIGVYYYFRVIYTMFLPREEEDGVLPQISGSHKILLTIAAILSLLMGIFPGILQGLL